jgi:hypothetical protein
VITVENTTANLLQLNASASSAFLFASIGRFDNDDVAVAGFTFGNASTLEQILNQVCWRTMAA